MITRLAACDPCRRSKLACDHKRPTCTRCSSRGQDASCIYRSRPFRRKATRSRSQELESPVQPEALATPFSGAYVATSPEAEITSSQPHRYPNPGYLGASSHSTIFNHVVSGAGSSIKSHHVTQVRIPDSPSKLLGDEVVTERAMHAVSRLHQMDTSEITPLVRSWIRKGVNLPLAEPFVSCCVETVEHLEEHLGYRSTSVSNLAAIGGDDIWVRSLLENTQKPIVIRGDMDLQEFLNQMTGGNFRWESLGIFFVAAARAAYDTPYFPTLYTTTQQRNKLLKALTYMGDCCLETCLALDCLNDLQLVLQYENFIIHSQVDGDQSYHSWRRIGDVASSLFALGYHEQLDGSTLNIPPFLMELRKACFARIYAADKSLAIFLGRPPRVVGDFCHFKIPDNPLEEQTALRSDQDSGDQATNCVEPINYTADARCSARFARLKEEVLLLLHRRHALGNRERVSDLRTRVDKQWQDLPSHFKLTTSLKNCQQNSFKRDFLAGTRLDYLHVHFLLGLVSQERVSEPNNSLLIIAAEMLSIALEVIILRDQLVNSGSCLVWKVAQYGLPAAGIISLALLNSPASIDSASPSKPKMIQDLSVLVAEITTGVWIQAGEPNFALFTRATSTIQSLLDFLLATCTNPYRSELPQTIDENSIAHWDPRGNSQLLDFELDFWANLAEHPTLMSHSMRWVEN